MFIGILYIFSFLVFLVTAILFKKDNKKHNIVLWSVISLFLTFIINSLLVFIPSLFNIASPLWLRSILFLGLSCPMLYRIINKKEIQKYEICWKDYVILVLALALTIFIGVYRFHNFNLRFETSDPATHYVYANTFVKSNKLMEKSPDDYMYHTKGTSSMFLAYTAFGTEIQLCDSFNAGLVAKTASFICLELLIIFSTSVVFMYSIIKKSSDFKISGFILSLVLCFLFILGYPFNNLIFGFHYLGLSILIGMILLNIISEVYDSKNNLYYTVIIALFAFSIFTSYYLFVPLFFGAGGLYLLYLWKFKKKFEFKIAVKDIILCLGIPFVIGMIYYFLPGLLTGNETGGISTFKMEGYIYRNLIGNFVLLLPLVLYKLIIDIKEKKISIQEFCFVLTSSFIVLLFYFLYNGEIASYYYYKLYYVLWALCFIIIGKALNEKNEKTNGFATTIIILLFSLFIFQIKGYDQELQTRNPLINSTGFSRGLEDIYWFNDVKNDDEMVKPIFYKSEINDLDKLSRKYKKELQDGKVIYYGDLLQKLWIYSYTDISTVGVFNYLGAFYLPEDAFDVNEVKYIMCPTKDTEKCEIDSFEKEYSNKTFTLYKKTDK